MKRYTNLLIVLFISIFAVTSVVGQMTKEEKRAKKKASREILKQVIVSIDEEKYVESISLIDSLLLLDPKNADGFYFKGLSLAKTNDTSTALVALEEGIIKAPLSSRLKILTSRLYLNQGKLDQALAHLESILKFKPKEPETLYLCGEIYLQKADTVLALEYFENALQYKLEGK